MTLPWIITAAAGGLAAGPRIRASVFAWSTGPGQPPRDGCPACGRDILPGRRRWLSLRPVTGRCPACRARIGPPPMAAELAAGLALAAVTARAPATGEAAALAWLVLLGVPLAFTDIAVRRLPHRLTATAFAGTVVLLAVAALAGHQPGRLLRALAGAAALGCFYLALALIRPGGIGGGDARLAASVGAVLAWAGWRALITGTFAAFALAAIYGGILIAAHRADRRSHMPLGPFILLGAVAAMTI